MAEAVFFSSAQAWREWLEQHHATQTDCLVGFLKVTTGQATMSWSDSVDQAICFGWIDGVRRRIDDRAYSIRFTRRKADSNWSAINVKKVEALRAAGLMRAAGEVAFSARSEAKTAIYSYEREAAELSPEQTAAFASNATAWAFWEAQAPWYRRNAVHWVVGAKRADTRDRRFSQLVADSAAGRRLRHLGGASATMKE